MVGVGWRQTDWEGHLRSAGNDSSVKGLKGESPGNKSILVSLMLSVWRASGGCTQICVAFARRLVLCPFGLEVHGEPVCLSDDVGVRWDVCLTC